MCGVSMLFNLSQKEDGPCQIMKLLSWVGIVVLDTQASVLFAISFEQFYTMFSHPYSWLR